MASISTLPPLAVPQGGLSPNGAVVSAQPTMPATESGDISAGSLSLSRTPSAAAVVPPVVEIRTSGPPDEGRSTSNNVLPTKS